MKKALKTILIAAIALATVTTLAACRKNNREEAGDSSGDARDSYTSYYESYPDADLPIGEDSFNRVMPTGTIVDSDEPEFPSDIVYLDPGRDLKDEYTFEEATSKYAIKLSCSTLICTSCDEIRMTHSFWCTDYGAGRYNLENRACCLDSDGNIVDCATSFFNLEDTGFTTLDEFFENIADVHFSSWKRRLDYKPDPEITVIDRTYNHIFVQVENNLYYARKIDDRVYYAYYDANYYDDPMTDKERGNFSHYAALMFDHLSPDDGSEPYIYDKLVNVPLFGRKHLSGFNRLTNINRNCIRVDADFSEVSIIIDPDADDIADTEYYTAWEDLGDMKVRIRDSYYTEYLFTIDGVSYLLKPMEGGADFKSVSDVIEALEDGGALV